MSSAVVCCERELIVDGNADGGQAQAVFADAVQELHDERGVEARRQRVARSRSSAFVT